MNNLTTMHDLAMEQPVFKVPLKDGSLYTLADNDLQMYKYAYPHINVDAELGKMIAWCVSNSSQRKTKRGILRFINGWLNRAKPQQPPAKTTTQKEHAASTTMQERVTDLSWADGL